MRILICGSRLWMDYGMVLDKLADELALHDIECVIEGECRGADLMGRRAAETLGIPVQKFPADWKKYGKRAGFMRNRQMLVEGKPDIVLAFNRNNSPGTTDMCDCALDVGIEVKVFTER